MALTAKSLWTRMHSNGLPTAHLLTVSQHALGRGVCIPACTGQGVCIPACTGQGVYIPACTGQGGVHPSMHWAGVCVSQHALGREVCIPACTGQGVSAGRGSAQGGVCLGVSAQGDVWQTPPRPEADTPCEQNDWQTGVKTLPCRNFVADGKNFQRLKVTCSRIWSNNPGLLIQYSTYWPILTWGS